jgi:hypothetical protein
MGGEVCKQLISKESLGEDAAYERELLKSWAKYPGYQAAGDALRSLGKSKSRRVKQAVNGNLPVGAK